MTTMNVNRPRRSRRHAHAGQVLPIFALVALLLFAVVGLAVDAGLSYLSFNGEERAAGSAALAGVTYMPNGFTAGNCGGGGTANAAACDAAARAGFPNGGTLNGNTISVQVLQYPTGCGGNNNPCASNKLTVTVTATVNTSFMRVLGFTAHSVLASDTAVYLPPIYIGQPGAQLGSDLNSLGTAGNYYLIRHEGWATDRGQGDAFTPNTQSTSYPSCVNGAEGGTGYVSSDVHAISYDNNSSDPTGSSSNPGGTEVANGTMTSGGFKALPTTGGYNYAVVVPNGIQGYVRVFNPSFSPDKGYTTNSNASYNYHEQDSLNGSSGQGAYDQWSVTEYTLFKVKDMFDHTQDTPIEQWQADPINAPSDGNTSNFFDSLNNENANIPSSIVGNVYHQWVNLSALPANSWTSGGNSYSLIQQINPSNLTFLTQGSYRLRVDLLDYKGLRPIDDAGANHCSLSHKGYALQLSVPGSGSSYTMCTDPGCVMSAIDEFAVYTPIIGSGSSNSFSIPIFQLPRDYAGKTVNFYLYDVGDVSGSGGTPSNTISIMNPDTSQPMKADDLQGGRAGSVGIYDLGPSKGGVQPITGSCPQASFTPGIQVNCEYPGDQPQGNIAAVQTIYNGNNKFNGHWLLFTLSIPAGYTNSTNGYWQMQYTVGGNTAAGDTFTMAVTTSAPPVHLI